MNRRTQVTHKHKVCLYTYRLYIH